MKTKILWLCAWFLVAMSCSDVQEKKETNNANNPDPTKEEIRENGGNDDIDYCELYGWYDDGECDDFCDTVDPDCVADDNV